MIILILKCDFFFFQGSLRGVSRVGWPEYRLPKGAVETLTRQEIKTGTDLMGTGQCMS